MELALRFIGTGIDGQSRSFDVMAISRPDVEYDLLLAEFARKNVVDLVEHEDIDIDCTHESECVALPLGPSCPSAFW
jgi:hypothetical protein